MSPFNSKPPSSANEGEGGIVELATDTETIEGTSTEVVTTPANIEAKVGASVVDTTLSGTPKVFRIKDNAGTNYYFKAYPTKV